MHPNNLFVPIINLIPFSSLLLVYDSENGYFKNTKNQIISSL